MVWTNPNGAVQEGAAHVGYVPGKTGDGYLAWSPKPHDRSGPPGPCRASVLVQSEHTRRRNGPSPNRRLDDAAHARSRPGIRPEPWQREQVSSVPTVGLHGE